MHTTSCKSLKPEGATFGRRRLIVGLNLLLDYQGGTNSTRTRQMGHNGSKLEHQWAGVLQNKSTKLKCALTKQAEKK